MKTIKMTPQQWHAVLPNPRQRDTEGRASRALHLRIPQPTHSTVFAAELPGGDLVKLDGHTRGHMWANGMASPAPSAVDVHVIPVKSMSEAKEFYSHYDSATTVEKARDKVFGAYRECCISPTSGLIKSGPITSALKKLGSGDVYSLVKQWKHELEAIDSLGIPAKKFSAGMLLGALIFVRVRGDRGLEFVSMVAADAGTRTAEGSDGVDAICRHAYGPGAKGGELVIRDTAGRFISAGEAWIAGRRYKQTVKATDIKDYLARAKR
ncbi:hypothetical protein C380_08750 [Acidovorax sp. KKS102]|uniref:hypothetical protein n=1 Tax=Acidovorax sp. KKS102 TaxID=358220 RepID=UPI00028BAA9C|nr:hypothetical protein [Acidovorax sp. KKS102]AFU45452.1 hypothetical protein C380_08750 [Acidovorax sp. KKS102]